MCPGDSVNSAVADAGREVRDVPGCTTDTSRSFAMVRGWLY